MLAVLMLQLSWSTVAAYCGHESGRAVQHVGHHASLTSAEGESPGDAGQPAKAASEALHSHCSSCSHTSLSSELRLTTFAVADAVRFAPRARTLAFSSPYAAPPERPQWTAAA